MQLRNHLAKSVLLPDLSLQLLSRTYAPSVAGVVQQMEYSHTTEHFTLVYYLTKMCTANTTEVEGSIIDVYSPLVSIVTGGNVFL